MSSTPSEPCVYLVHLDKPFGHARHYLGYAEHLAERLEHHWNGTGANLLRHVRAAGITWQLARTWPGKDRTFERKQKTRGHTRLCPICKEAQKAATNEGE